jgi:hypothetical protein
MWKDEDIAQHFGIAWTYELSIIYGIAIYNTNVGIILNNNTTNLGI